MKSTFFVANFQKEIRQSNKISHKKQHLVRDERMLAAECVCVCVCFLFFFSQFFGIQKLANHLQKLVKLVEFKI